MINNYFVSSNLLWEFIYELLLFIIETCKYFNVSTRSFMNGKILNKFAKRREKNKLNLIMVEFIPN